MVQRTSDSGRGTDSVMVQRTSDSGIDKVLLDSSDHSEIFLTFSPL